MASYINLKKVLRDEGLRNQAEIALLVAADKVMAEADTVPNHAIRLVWARDAMLRPKSFIEAALNVLVAQNKTASESQIRATTDAQMQTKVDGVVDFLAGV